MSVCSVQCSISEAVRGKKGRMGDNLWSGLGEMFGFSWHLHFHYPGRYDLWSYKLRLNQTQNNILTFQPSKIIITPVSLTASHHRVLLHLPGPGAGDDDGGAPQPVPGRVWVARVIPALLSQSETSIVTTDQSEASTGPCQPIARHTDMWGTKTICHRPQTNLANIYFYQSQ